MSIIQEMAHRPQNENSNRSPLQPRLHLSTSQTLDEADIRWMTLPWPESEQESLHRLDHFFHLRYLQLLHKNFPLSDECQGQKDYISGFVGESFLDAYFISGIPDGPSQRRKASQAHLEINPQFPMQPVHQQILHGSGIPFPA
jgi:hypothetical protein